jgi:hypothetical protein
MDGLKGISEIIEHLLYETFGLVLPGGAFCITLVAIIGNPLWNNALQFATDHPWITLAGAYILGYPIQGMSRVVTTLFEWLLLLPGRILFKLIGIRSSRIRNWSQKVLQQGKGWLTGRHSHTTLVDSASIDLTELATSYWTNRLSLPKGKKLSLRQVQDLSFSTIQSERKHLDRIRASASLARGVATVVVVNTVFLVYQLIFSLRVFSSSIFLILVGLIIGFFGLMERADMYDRLWRTIVPSQFLSTISRDASASQTATPKEDTHGEG